MANNVSFGPGSISDDVASPPEYLESVDDSHYVTVLNPLPVPFYGMVGVDKPVNEPFTPRQTPNMDLLTKDESDLSRNYGLSLKNKDHPSKRHITHTIVLPAGKPINLLGGQAKTVVRQLVTAVLQYEEKKQLIADRFARRQIEEQVVINVSAISDVLGDQPQSPRAQAQAAINKLNETHHEPEFPEVTLGAGNTEVGAGESQFAEAGRSTDSVGESTNVAAPGRKAPGRPRGRKPSGSSPN